MSEIIPGNLQNSQLPAITENIVAAIGELTQALGVPREVLASDEEIEYAWKDLPRELRQIPEISRNPLLVRMCVAVSVGLFDSAVNYAWNVAILQLKNKVRNFGLPIVARTLQKDFEERDLLELVDSPLLNLCLKLNLITEDGYFLLDQCRDIRNNFSAAHPTIGQLDDREFINFLNRCGKYAIAESSSPRGIDISDFISALKGSEFTQEQVSMWIERLDATHDAQRELLFGTINGIYCDPNTEESTRINALKICLRYKDKLTSAIRSVWINRHSDYLAKGDMQRYAISQQFFEKMGEISILNKHERHTIISKAIEHLINAHTGWNNFYNEPPFAERLAELSGQGALPDSVQQEFVHAVIACYIGNGSGVSRNAIPFYESMIRKFSPREIQFMIQIPKTNTNTKIRITKITECKRRFVEAVKLINPSSVPDGIKPQYDSIVNRSTIMG